jgi:hypothetical protein
MFAYLRRAVSKVSRPAAADQPAPPGLALQLAIQQHTEGIAKAIRAYAVSGGTDDPPPDVRLVYAEQLALDDLFKLLVAVHAQLDNLMGADDETLVERKHRLLRDHIICHFLSQAMNAAADAAALREEDPMNALFDDVDLYSSWALTHAGAALEVA